MDTIGQTLSELMVVIENGVAQSDPDKWKQLSKNPQLPEVIKGLMSLDTDRMSQWLVALRLATTMSTSEIIERVDPLVFADLLDPKVDWSVVDRDAVRRVLGLPKSS